MSIVRNHFSVGIFLSALLLVFGGMQVAQAGEAGFVSVKSSSSYDDTVSKLRQAVSQNGMMVLGEINQGKVMSDMTGMDLKAISLFVGNPNVGKKLFTANSGVGIVLPARINIYEGNGSTYINYFKPSAQLKAFGNDKLVMMGQMLDKKLHKMTAMLGK